MDSRYIGSNWEKIKFFVIKRIFLLDRRILSKHLGVYDSFLAKNKKLSTIQELLNFLFTFTVSILLLSLLSFLTLADHNHWGNKFFFPPRTLNNSLVSFWKADCVRVPRFKITFISKWCISSMSTIF